MIQTAYILIAYFFGLFIGLTIAKKVNNKLLKEFITEMKRQTKN